MWDIFFISILLLLSPPFFVFRRENSASGQFFETRLQIRLQTIIHMLFTFFLNSLLNSFLFIPLVASFSRLFSDEKQKTWFNNWSQNAWCPSHPSFHSILPVLRKPQVIRDEILLFRVTFRWNNLFPSRIKISRKSILYAGTLCVGCTFPGMKRIRDRRIEDSHFAIERQSYTEWLQQKGL